MFEISKEIFVGKNQKLLLIAGPCQIESLEHCLMIGQNILKILSKNSWPINFVFKSSYDKANRSSVGSKRGPGLESGLRILEKVRQELGVPVLTDVHSPEEATVCGEIVDILQTPAFLCRQTDLLTACGKTGKTVNIKKGQFLAPEDMQFAADKIASTGNSRIMLCERGTSFGYRDLVVDMRGLYTMQKSGYPVVFDATHSVQQLGSSAGVSQGNNEFCLPLIKAAMAVNLDGLFIECHEEPRRAPSDAMAMLPLTELEKVLNSALRIKEAAASL